MHDDYAACMCSKCAMHTMDVYGAMLVVLIQLIAFMAE